MFACLITTNHLPPTHLRAHTHTTAHAVAYNEKHNPPTHLRARTHITAHAVAYNEKHNDANGEGNRDGSNDNFSWNCGVEGRTDNAGGMLHGASGLLVCGVCMAGHVRTRVVLPLHPLYPRAPSPAPGTQPCWRCGSGRCATCTWRS